MLSTQLRLRLESIATRISKGEEVSLEDMIWADKLAKSNRSAYSILRKARREAIHGESHPDSMDGFLNALDLGNLDAPRSPGPLSADEITEFFRRDDGEEWLRRD